MFAFVYLNEQTLLPYTLSRYSRHYLPHMFDDNRVESEQLFGKYSSHDKEIPYRKGNNIAEYPGFV